MLTFTDDGNKLIKSPSFTTINLFEVYYDKNNPTICSRFAAWDVDVAFGEEVYSKAVIQIGDIATDSSGKIGDVLLTVGNADRMIQYFIETYDLIGCVVRHIQIFQGVDDFISTTFKIKVAAAKKNYATFTLSLGIDFLTAEIPARTVFSRFCWHQFLGVDGDCGYTGADAACDRTFEDCNRKGNLARFGGFPAIPNERIYI